MPVTCADGTTADTLEECPQLVDYEADIGYEAEGEFIDDVTTTGVDESIEDIYNAIGGSDWTGQTLQEFTDMYGDDFPTWAGSEYELKSNLIESQLAMIPDLMDLSKRGLELESETNKLSLETAVGEIREGREARIRAGGGMLTGESEDKIQSAYGRVLSGFDLQEEGIDIKRESSLFDFEGRRLDYQVDLSDIKQDFQDRMWDLIATSLDKYKAIGDGVDCPEGYDVCNVCGGGQTDVSQCPSSAEGEIDSDYDDEGQDWVDTGYDEGQGGDPFEGYDYDYEGFGEDYDYDDWGDEEDYS